MGDAQPQAHRWCARMHGLCALSRTGGSSAIFVRLSCQGEGALLGTAQLHRGKTRPSVCGAARVASASGMEFTVTHAQVVEDGRSGATGCTAEERASGHVVPSLVRVDGNSCVGMGAWYATQTTHSALYRKQARSKETKNKQPPACIIAFWEQKSLYNDVPPHKAVVDRRIHK